MNFKQQIEAKMEAAKAPDPEPEADKTPKEVPTFEDPAVRAEWLSDQLADAKAELEKERGRRQEAEQRLVARKPTLQGAFRKRRNFK
jgi:hypothetical protein